MPDASSRMAASQHLMDTILQLLQRTTLHAEECAPYVATAFQSDFYDDFRYYVEIGEKHYLLRQYERGRLEAEYRTKRAEDVIYLVLEDVIHDLTHRKLLQKYKVDDASSYLKNTESIRMELTAGINECFRQIGGVYEQWHESGRRRTFESRQRL
ncbi:Imm63 family immunity protein [Paenibacillus sp. GCM10027626]|uniref:Imm63 family immunity protein n=1 Tax=Paenibacillus sp. GCM10027626 TaxID=3273411 RepID=UPI0036255FC0